MAHLKRLDERNLMQLLLASKTLRKGLKTPSDPTGSGLSCGKRGFAELFVAQTLSGPEQPPFGSPASTIGHFHCKNAAHNT